MTRYGGYHLFKNHIESETEMSTSATSLEDLYARLNLEEEDEGGVIIAREKYNQLRIRMFWLDVF